MPASENGHRTALIVDYGGVLTTSLFDSFAEFCTAEGIEPQAVAQAFRHDKEARRLLIELECGRLREMEFEPALAAKIGVAEPRGMIKRMMAGATPETTMLDAVRAARAAGVRTGLLSNSWGTRSYDPAMLAELFDGVVISGEEGMRKPAPEIYALAAERTGVAPEACVYVDDLPFNLKPAEELGMATIHHVSAEQTIAELERLLGVAL